MKKVVLIIIPKIESYLQFCNSLGVELIQQGFTVKLLTSNPNGQKISDIEVFHLGFPRALNLLHHYDAATQIKRIVKVVNPDIVHVHFSACIFTVSLAIEKDWPCTIATFHGLSFPLITSYWKKTILRKAEIISAKKYFQVSVLTKDDERAMLHYIPENKVYCYKSKGIGCNIEIFDKKRFSQIECSALRTKLSLLDSDFILIFIGRFVHFKGFGLVVKAFFYLSSHFPNMKLLLLGQKDPIHASGLTVDEELQLEKSSNVRILGWTSNVEQYLAISDLLLFPSEREGMPVNVMEALAMGVPVVTTNTRGCKELVNKNNGWILKRRNTEELIEAIEILYKNKERLRTLSDYALLHREEYDRKRYVTEQVNIYKSILKNANIK